MFRTLLLLAPAFVVLFLSVSVAPNQVMPTAVNPSSENVAPQPTRVAGVDRLPVAELDVTPPAERTNGVPGEMRTVAMPCRDVPSSEIRRRVVDIATQEWAFFGFPIRDQQEADLSDEEPQPRPYRGGKRGPRRGGSAEEGARVASTIAGYWSVTPEGPGIVKQQNKSWNSEFGTGARWDAAWSAAFISWVMCEAGLSSTDQFKRAVAHVTYIDQAIRARDVVNKKGTPQTAFVAYDRGEKEISPGDLLCAGNRPIFRSLAERRRQLGKGASSHCDVVVKVDEAKQQILTIGGNVGGRVSLKIRAAAVSKQGALAPTNEAIFAHLKLRSLGSGDKLLESDALDHTPTMQAQALLAKGCSDATPANQLRAWALVLERSASCE